MGTITRVFKFDAAHRVMNERFKCFNLHGHTFKVEVTFRYDKIGPLGYAIDFKEVKRIIGDYIDQRLDHSCILNPQDTALANLCYAEGWKLYIMGLGNDGDYNPSAENLASELFYTFSVLMSKDDLKVLSVKLYETENCWVETNESNYAASPELYERLSNYSETMGSVNYDARCQ